MTDRRWSSDERRAERAAAIAKLGYWDADLNNNILYHSPEYLTVHGLPLGRQIRRQEEIYELVHPEDVERLAADFEKVDRLACDYQVEYRIVRPNGDITHIREIGEVVRDEANRPVGHTGTSQDVTDQYQIQDQLRRALAQAEANLKAKELFLANMSHELRTPLNAISGYAEALLDKQRFTLDEARERDYLSSIQLSSRHLTTLIEDILMQAEFQMVGGSAVMTEVHVTQFLNEVISISGLSQVETGQNLILDIDPPDARVAIDRRLVRQALINIISNAKKHGDSERGIRISYNQEPSWFRFAVEDWGVGIPRHEISQVLQPFVRGHTARSQARPGTGLGLALANEIMSLHGGRLEIASDSQRRGTTVTMTFPR